MSKAENDWVLYLDADERIDDELKSSIKKIITDETKYAAYFLRRKNFYFGKCQWPKIE